MLRFRFSFTSTRYYATQARFSFPFPDHADPTPYQIFHLPHNASPSDIKARYIDLVRIYHPDSALTKRLNVPPDIAHSRFQAITSAYDTLRGNPSTGGRMPTTHQDSAPTTASWRASNTSRPDLHAGGDERWKDRLIFGAIACTIAVFVIQTNSTRRESVQEVLKARGREVESPEARRARELRELSEE